MMQRSRARSGRHSRQWASLRMNFLIPLQICSSRVCWQVHHRNLCVCRTSWSHVHRPASPRRIPRS